MKKNNSSRVTRRRRRGGTGKTLKTIGQLIGKTAKTVSKTVGKTAKTVTEEWAKDTAKKMVKYMMKSKHTPTDIVFALDKYGNKSNYTTIKHKYNVHGHDDDDSDDEENDVLLTPTQEKKI